ncbi:radical SAM protein [Bradyrhizobium liaoningense]|uniref:radical SAM/SPASM domain-containing protein n=1 Tax=Bradyrhizobium liaoningense TaxID=43992 RepID=UPI001BAD25FA|nr:radical SAM/SPASM domain-containing protein [Bradyrhizobium liaoningense]MBR0843874.1 radical SAM protein [Bradyrhizobium liaoningense]
MIKFSFDRWKRSARVYPKTYQVEVFAGCNLKCPLCHAGRREIGRDAKFLHLEDFKAIFDKIKPHVELLYLHIWGEPTLNKHLIDMVRYVHKQKPNCVTNVSTHGNGLSRQYAFDLIEAGLGQLIVSIDGSNQETYEKYRVGGRFDEALSFLRFAAEAKAELKSNVLLIAQCIQMKQTLPEFEEFRKLVAFEGVNPVFKPIYVGGYGVDYRDFVSDDVEVQKPTLSSCTALDDVVAIQADGTVIPCCLYPTPAAGIDLGNIFGLGLDDLLDLDSRKMMRDRIKAGDAPTRVCAQACGNGACNLSSVESEPGIGSQRSKSA